MKNEQGAIMILTIIIISAIISVIVIQAALSSLTHLSAAQVQYAGQLVENQTESCAYEALVQLNRDNTYMGGTFSLGDGSCTIAITGSSNARTVAVEATLDSYTRSISVDVTLSPFAIDEWD